MMPTLIGPLRPHNLHLSGQQTRDYGGSRVLEIPLTRFGLLCQNNLELKVEALLPKATVAQGLMVVTSGTTSALVTRLLRGLSSPTVAAFSAIATRLLHAQDFPWDNNHAPSFPQYFHDADESSQVVVLFRAKVIDNPAYHYVKSAALPVIEGIRNSLLATSLRKYSRNRACEAN
ncbi:hypothetical protein HAX54_047294 [Datura stramonium]|uniref:Uncharacterized protein n=1 Tax=Datura stramonium TaxID=4076 RepID=A0ABS8SSZ8_DATST|nr:hypothetical protein [Datura stramonium]